MHCLAPVSFAHTHANRLAIGLNRQHWRSARCALPGTAADRFPGIARTQSAWSSPGRRMLCSADPDVPGSPGDNSDNTNNTARPRPARFGTSAASGRNNASLHRWRFPSTPADTTRRLGLAQSGQLPRPIGQRALLPPQNRRALQRLSFSPPAMGCRARR